MVVRVVATHPRWQVMKMLFVSMVNWFAARQQQHQQCENGAVTAPAIAAAPEPVTPPPPLPYRGHGKTWKQVYRVYTARHGYPDRAMAYFIAKANKECLLAMLRDEELPMEHVSVLMTDSRPKVCVTAHIVANARRSRKQCDGAV